MIYFLSESEKKTVIKEYAGRQKQLDSLHKNMASHMK